ncbi:MAG: hypothetical protein NC218_10350 [Acetobacter sp.]|nr:hypothetical protein [Acetobacter sp.]
MFLLICHRSERSEVKRSRESMGDVYLWIAPLRKTVFSYLREQLNVVVVVPSLQR